ncbi:hypothetical protein BDP67DRAFT_501907 [Colletotrichum lupini]|nr:hypothetical protein BDP67DRAFT_501907 [Colletotrichum lupini]
MHKTLKGRYCHCCCCQTWKQRNEIPDHCPTLRRFLHFRYLFSLPHHPGNLQDIASNCPAAQKNTESIYFCRQSRLSAPDSSKALRNTFLDLTILPAPGGSHLIQLCPQTQPWTCHSGTFSPSPGSIQTRLFAVSRVSSATFSGLRQPEFPNHKKYALRSSEPKHHYLSPFIQDSTTPPYPTPRIQAVALPYSVPCALHLYIPT